jgi:hypothetical protein
MDFDTFLIYRIPPFTAYLLIVLLKYSHFSHFTLTSKSFHRVNNALFFTRPVLAAVFTDSMDPVAFLSKPETSM